MKAIVHQTYGEPDVLTVNEVALPVPGDDDVSCVIRLGAGGRWVAEYYPLELITDDGTYMDVRFSAADPMVAAGLLLRLGDQGELLEGDEVRTTLARLRSSVLTRYGVEG